MKQCPECNKELLDSAMFCTYCGAKLEELAKEDGKTEEHAAEEAVADQTGTGEVPVNPAALADSADDKAEAPASAGPAATPESPVEPVRMPVPPAAAVTEPEKKPGGKGKMIGIAIGVVAVVAAAGVGVAAIGSNMFKDPKDTVIDAFKSVYQEERIDYLDDIFGYKELYKAAGTQNMEVGLGLTMEETSNYYLSDYNGAGFDMLFKSDVESKKYQGDFDFRYSGMDVLKAAFYMDESEIMVAVPELSGKVFTLNYADDLEGQIEKSPFLGSYISSYLGSGKFDMQAAMEYNEYMTSIQNQEEGSPFNLDAMWERYKTGSQAIDDLKAAMVVEKGDKAVKIVDGKEQKCTAYNVVIPGEAVVTFAETTSEFFLDDETIKIDVLEFLEHTMAYTKSLGAGGYGTYGYYDDSEEQTPVEMRDELWDDAEDELSYMLEELEEMLQDDIMMTVYVDSQGRMAAIELTTELTADDDTVELTFDAQLKGGAYLLQNVDAELTVSGDFDVSIVLEKSESYENDVLTADVLFTVEEDSYNTEIAYTGSYTKASGDYEMELTVENKYNNYTFAMEGVVEEFEKGKSLDITADKLVFESESSYGGTDSMEFSGNYSVKPLESGIEQPSGEKMDILAATMMEWMGVAGELESNMEKLEDIFQ